MNVLLLYPRYPDTYWSFRHALRFIASRALLPPLGLITVSAMLPGNWKKKLVDLNIETLKTKDILWADYIFISAMSIQKASVTEILKKCAGSGAKIVAGGPLFTQEYQEFPEIDHFVLNEAEITLPPFLEDLESGSCRRVYSTNGYAEEISTLTPDFHLLSLKKYASMSIQISRGCPFSCDFCEITTLLGHKVRMKSTPAILAELDEIYRLGWRGGVFIVDDNFIGNINRVKYDLLPALKLWMQKHKFPFLFTIEASINLADDEELMTLLTESGCAVAFIGIETPVEESLQDCNKIQNKNRNLLESVRKIEHAGIVVSGGFIVGFDSDSPSVFQRQIEFIRDSGIVSAMVGLLNAPKNTKLYNRLKSENRLIEEYNGNNTDISINFIPRMNYNELVEGYGKIIRSIYQVKPYYQRVRLHLLNYRRPCTGKRRITFKYILGFVRSVFILGIFTKGRLEYWKLFLWTLVRRPRSFSDAIVLSVYGYHFRAVYGLSKTRLRKNSRLPEP